MNNELDSVTIKTFKENAYGSLTLNTKPMKTKFKNPEKKQCCENKKWKLNLGDGQWINQWFCCLFGQMTPVVVW